LKAPDGKIRERKVTDEEIKKIREELTLLQSADVLVLLGSGLGPRPTRPYRFAPHFARTLSTVNYAFAERLSSHNPILVDFSFEEPKPLH